MHIFTPDTKCDFIGCDVPNISVEKFASNACHAIRTQFAEREHVSRLFEWVIDTQKTVTISRPFVYAAPEYGKLCDPDNEPLPCPLQTLQHRQIRAQIVAGRGLDVAVSELACDH